MQAMINNSLTATTIDHEIETHVYRQDGMQAIQRTKVLASFKGACKPQMERF